MLFLSIILFTEVVVKTSIFCDGSELVESIGEDTSEKQAKKATTEYYSNLMRLSFYDNCFYHDRSLSSVTFSFETFAFSQIIIEIPIPPPESLV